MSKMAVPIEDEPGVIIYKSHDENIGDEEASAIGAELEAIRRVHIEVTEKSVVKAAEPSSSAMHRHFTWDDVLAAQKQREGEARRLIGVIYTTKVVSNGVVPQLSPNFKLTSMSPQKPDRSYAPVMGERSEPVLSNCRVQVNVETVVDKAIAELERFVDRYDDIDGLAHICAAIRNILHPRTAMTGDMVKSPWGDVGMIKAGMPGYVTVAQAESIRRDPRYREAILTQKAR